MSVIIKKVGDISTQIRGVTYNKQDAVNSARPGYYPVLRAGNIEEYGLTFNDLVYVPASKVSQKQLLRKNDILIAASSGSIEVVGKAAPALSDFAGAFGAFCKVLRPSKEVDPNYFANYFKTPDYRRRVSFLAAGANINNLRNEDLDNLEIPLPPLEEQKRIAAILDAADALRAKRREAIALLDTLIQSTFLEMFGDPITNPKGWKETKVGKICDLVRGSSPRPKGDKRYYDGSIPRLMVADITRDGFKVTPRIDSLTVEGAKKSRPIPANTIVMAVSGDVGIVSEVQVPCCIHDGFVAFLKLNESNFRSLYFMYQFHLLKITHEQRKAGAIFKNLTTSDIKAMLVPNPPVKIQDRFIQLMYAIEQQQNLQREFLAELDTLFASLQSRAFRGEL